MKNSLGAGVYIRGYARVLAEPTYSQIVRSERLLRRSIPILILSFLAIVALVRFAQLLEQRRDITAEVARDLTIAAELLTAESKAMATLPTGGEDVAGFLTSQLPAALIETGRLVVVSNLDGTIIEAMPGWEWLEGENLSRLTTLGRSSLRFSRAEDVVETTFRNSKALAASAVLHDEIGVVTIIQKETGYLAKWRRSISINVTLFTFTSIILIVVLYAYIRQAGRAEDADALYLETHQMVDTALSLGHCGLWDWDIASGQIYWSRSMYAMLGMRPREEAMHLDDFAPLLHPADGNFLHIARQIASGRLSKLDRTLRMRRADGDYLWVRARADVIQTAAGETHMVGIAVDVTDKQVLAARSSQIDRQLHDAIESISETFVLCDGADGIVLCNSKYRAIFGLTEADTATGLHLSQIMKKSRKPIETRPLFSPTFVEGERASEVLMPDGRWLLLSERRTKDGGFISIGADITQLKLQQERLYDSERRLTTVIEDLRTTRRDAERKASQLQDLNVSYMAEKTRAETASRAKTTFLANMSHELRTPLNAILGFSEIMKNNTFGPLGSPKYNEYADDIHESGQFLLGLIGEILDMAKIDSGRLALTRRPFQLDQAVAEAARIVQPPETPTRIKIESDGIESLSVVADKRAIKQVLINLMSNAVKFSDAEDVVRVRVKAVGGTALITVVDRGGGIPAEMLAKIGRPFEHAETEWTRDKKGTGLGLAIARSLVEMHGGRLRIASSEGEGTIVTLRLPMSETRADIAA